MGKYINDVLVKVGTIISKKTQKSFKTLREALDASSKCGCGLDCCENEFRMRDKSTGETRTMYWEDGVLTVKIGETVKTVRFVEDEPEPDPGP